MADPSAASIGVSVTVGHLTVRDRPSARDRWGAYARELERGDVLIDQAHPDLREHLLHAFIVIPARDRVALAQVLLAWDTASDPGAAFVSAEPWRHRAGEVCGICGVQHAHEHQRLRCIECGAKGLDQEMAGPDARHVCPSARLPDGLAPGADAECG